MCGIAAVFHSRSETEALSVVSGLLSRISHRGSSMHQGEKVSAGTSSLGCNRLPFTSGAERQPVESPSGRYTVLLNGEIYSYHPQACAIGLSDTALLARAIEEQGIEVLARVDGMFGVIVFDHHLQQLYAARDRLGIKPLYWATSHHGILFASEAKALTPVPSVQSIMDVPPGAILLFTPGEEQPLVLKQTPFANERLFAGDYHEFVDQLGTTITDAVANQSSDKQRYGVFLSGGLDSAGILANLKIMGRDVVPIVVGSPNSPDVSAARALSRALEVPLHIVPCPAEENLFETIHSTIQTVESFEPNVVRQSTISRILAHAARSLGVNVVLCGEGADELFGGYPEFAVSQDFEKLRLKFLADINRTQLTRVDRTAMAETIEVRVPYLANSIVSLALSTATANWFIEENKRQPFAISKRCLRDALQKSTDLDATFINRPKVVLSEGAGVGGNDPHSGLFANCIKSAMTDEHAVQTCNQFPEYDLKSKEEAFYFNIFRSFGYKKIYSSRHRVFANTLNSITGRVSAGNRVVIGTF